MTISFVTSGLSATNNASVASMASAACNVTTGDHIVVYARWEGGDTTVTMSDTAGNTYTALTSQYNIAHGMRAFYCLNATGNASNVATAAFAANRTFTRCEQLVFRSTNTMTYQGVAFGSSTGSTTVANTSSFNLTHPALSVALRTAYNSGTTTSFVGSSGGTYTAVTSESNVVGSAYKITTANLSSETVTATVSGSTTSIIGVLQFVEASASTSTCTVAIL